MYKRPKSVVFDAALRRSRERFGAVMIERDSELRGLIKAMRAGRIFYYLPDQDPGDSSFVFAPFFGVPTATVTALGRIARLADAVVIPCSTRIRSCGRGYEVQFDAPLENVPSGVEQGDAAAMNAAVEKTVRRNPAQYMWTYKRFKTRPVGERDFYAAA
jgi:lauroyl/myristoyl acyltransferase